MTNDRKRQDAVPVRKDLLNAFCVIAGDKGLPGKLRAESVRKAEETIVAASPRAVLEGFRAWWAGGVRERDVGPDPYETDEKSAPPAHRRVSRVFG